MREHFWHRRNVGGKRAAIRWARKGVAMAPDGMRRDSWGPASGSIYPTGPAVLLNIVSSLQQQVDWLQREQPDRSEEHTSELQSLMRISYAVFCLKKKKKATHKNKIPQTAYEANTST